MTWRAARARLENYRLQSQGAAAQSSLELVLREAQPRNSTQATMRLRLRLTRCLQTRLKANTAQRVRLKANAAQQMRFALS